MMEEKQSISHTFQKSQIPFRKGCEKFVDPTKNSHTQLCFAKTCAGVRTYFVTLEPISQTLCKVQ